MINLAGFNKNETFSSCTKKDLDGIYLMAGELWRQVKDDIKYGSDQVARATLIWVEDCKDNALFIGEPSVCIARYRKIFAARTGKKKPWRVDAMHPDVIRSYNGFNLNLRDWAEKLNIKEATMLIREKRYRDDPTPERLEAIYKQNDVWRDWLIEYDGMTKPAGEWARIKGLRLSNLKCRYEEFEKGNELWPLKRVMGDD